MQTPVPKTPCRQTGMVSNTQAVYAVGLTVLAAAFLLRVVGQMLVAFLHVEFLPPMEEWYSGLICYPVLLPMQLVILGVQAKISQDVWRGDGFFAHRRPRTGIVLYWLSAIYFTVMVVRYAVTMYLYPERRWFAGTIPISFHFVLAAYLFVLGRYQYSADCDCSTTSGDRHAIAP